MLELHEAGGKQTTKETAMCNERMTFVCECCDEERPRHLRQITSHDLSAEFDLPESSLVRQVRHCSDRAACEQLAEDIDNWRLPVDPNATDDVVWNVPGTGHGAEEPLLDPWAFEMVPGE